MAAAIVVPDAALLVAGENGIGKRTGFDEYRIQSRGGKGIITMKTGDKTGGVVGALTVRDTDEIMLITVGGQMVRIPVQGHPRGRPQHDGRETRQPRRRRQTAGHRARHQRGKGRIRQRRECSKLGWLGKTR